MKLWLYQLEKKPYFSYGKRAEIKKVSKLLLTLILTHGEAIWIFIVTPGGRLKREIKYKGGVSVLLLLILYFSLTNLHGLNSSNNLDRLICVRRGVRGSCDHS